MWTYANAGQFQNKGEWGWDPTKGRYRYPPVKDGTLGRLVPPQYVRNLFERNLAAAEKRAQDAARRFTAGEMTPRQFQYEMRRQLADEHLMARMLSVGGREFMTRRHYQDVSDAWRQDTRYMARWTRLIVEGEGGTAAQIINRAGKYAAANIRAEFDAGQLLSDIAAGMGEERWVTSAGSASCEDCRALASRGWVTLGDLPMIGSNKCKSGCNCHKERRPMEGARVRAQ